MDIPKLKGAKIFDNIDISTVVPYIDSMEWTISADASNAFKIF